jgi:negative regulator of flagellin synthesis FlgM
MKISTDDTRAFRTKKGKKGKSSSRSSETKFQPRGDCIRLSSNGKMVSKTVRLAMNAPEIRLQKVKQIKELVDSGQYIPDARKTAAKLVKEDLHLLLPQDD